MFVLFENYAKRYPALAIAFACFCNFGAVPVAIAGEEPDNNHHRQQALADQERDLLRQSDELSRDIFELKGTINRLANQLDAKQDRYRQINHALITLHMELLP